MIQGDIISPIFFILALDQLIQKYDKGGQGVKVGKINTLRVLGYADDAAMSEGTVTEMSKRLTQFADKAMEKADMKMKMSKTFSQIVQTQKKMAAATEAEVKKKEVSYKHACEFIKAGCTQRFKTAAGMRIHCTTCNFN